MKRKPKGFKAFDELARKLIKVPPSALSEPFAPLGLGTCDGCGAQNVEVFAIDGAPLAGGAICAKCRNESEAYLRENLK